MNTKLLSFPKTAQLISVWVPTGNPRFPLLRRWIDATLPLNEQEGGLLLCA